MADCAQTYQRLGLAERPVLVNGTPGVIYTRRGQPFSVLGFTIDILADPDRIADLDVSGFDDQQR